MQCVRVRDIADLLQSRDDPLEIQFRFEPRATKFAMIIPMLEIQSRDPSRIILPQIRELFYPLKLLLICRTDDVPLNMHILIIVILVSLHLRVRTVHSPPMQLVEFLGLGLAVSHGFDSYL